MNASRFLSISALVLALAAAAGLGLYRVCSPHRGPRLEHAVRVEIARPRGVIALTVGEDGRWRLERPDDLADQEGARALLDGLRGLTLGPVVAGPRDAAAHGLGPGDEVLVKVRARGSDRPVFIGRFGRRALGRRLHYRADSDAPIVLAEGPEPALLTRDADDWRETRLLPDGCDNLEASAGKKGFVPIPPALAARLCVLRGVRPLPQDTAALVGLDRPFLRVRAAGGGFEVGARLGVNRAVRPAGRSVVFRVPAAALEDAANVLK